MATLTGHSSTVHSLAFKWGENTSKSATSSSANS